MALIEEYRAHLIRGELAAATVEKYTRCAAKFLAWADGSPLSKDLFVSYKATLTDSAATVNGVISALNSFLTCLQHPEWKLRQLRMQRQIFRREERDLSRLEFERLVKTAERLGNQRLARAIETIAATGIRVSELRFFTVEALRAREVTITNKGKTRTVLLPGELTAKLMRYARSRGIKGGKLFVTRSGAGLSRIQLWTEMKSICSAAGVSPMKVFPHNLRHLFAVVHYRLHRDIVKLADLLGHSSVNTTRIYLVETGKEHLRQLEAMRLVL